MQLSALTYDFWESPAPVAAQIAEPFHLCADLHFGHKNLLQYEPIRAQLANTFEEMDELLIARWNSQIKAEDDVLLLGDVSMCNTARTIEMVNRLNGRKHLVIGNHDRDHTTTFWRRLFVQTWNTPIIIGSTLYSHEPVSPAYLAKYGAILNVHGHTHSKSFCGDRRYCCVSLESTGMRPLSLCY